MLFRNTQELNQEFYSAIVLQAPVCGDVGLPEQSAMSCRRRALLLSCLLIIILQVRVDKI